MTNGQWIEKKFDELLKWLEKHSLIIGAICVLIFLISIILANIGIEQVLAIGVPCLVLGPTFTGVWINKWMQEEHEEKKNDKQ